jgi:hypothetical protein
MLDIVLCEMTGRPPSTGDIFCSTPLPVPFAEKNFWNKRVAQVITDQRTRNAFFASLISDTTADLLKSEYDSKYIGTTWIEQGETRKGQSDGGRESDTQVLSVLSVRSRPSSSLTGGY